MRSITLFFTAVVLAASATTSPVHGVTFPASPAPGPASLQEAAIEVIVRAAEQPQGLAGATVILEETGAAAPARREVTTGNDGRFVFESVAAGDYRITVGMLGRRQETLEVTVVAGQPTRVDFALEVDAVTLDELVVTGTVLPTSVREVPTPITIVSRSDIERLDPRNVAELVRTAVPGAVYSDEGPGARYGAFSVRGVSGLGAASTLKVYVDGAEVADPAYVTNLDPSIIERVEVISGPQASTIYGSRAISGVMQIFTKRGSGGDWLNPELSGAVQLEMVESPHVSGNPQAPEYRVALSGGDSRFGYNLGYSEKEEPQWVDLLVQKDRNFFGSVNFALGGLEVSASSRVQDGLNERAWNPVDRGIFRSLGLPDQPPPREFFDSDLETHSVGVGYKGALGWDLNFQWGFDRYRDSYYDAVPDEMSNYTVRSRDTNRSSAAFNLTRRLELSADFSSTVVLGWDRSSYTLAAHDPIEVSDWRDYNRPPDDFTNESDNNGYFTQVQLGFSDAVYLTGGLRADGNPEASNFGITWSPRIGLTGVRQAGEFTFKPRIAWGQAVIVPTANQVGGDENEFSILQANPDLRAQVQRGYDLGVDVLYGTRGSIGLTYFDQDPVDLIQLVFVGSDLSGPRPRSILQYQNLHRMNNRGWELKFEAQPTQRLALNANYGRTNSTVVKLDESYSGDYEEGQTLDERPLWTASIGASVTLREGTNLNVDLTHLAGWRLADFAGFLGDIYGGTFNPVAKPYPGGYLIDYPGFTKLHMSLSQALPGGLSVFIHVHNLTNNDNFERINTAVPRPRTWTFGLRF